MTEKQSPFEGFTKGFNKAEFESKTKALFESFQDAVDNVTTLTVQTDYPRGLLSTTIALDGDIKSTLVGELNEHNDFLEYHHKLVSAAMRNRMEVVRLLVDVLGIGKLAALL